VRLVEDVDTVGTTARGVEVVGRIDRYAARVSAECIDDFAVGIQIDHSSSVVVADHDATLRVDVSGVAVPLELAVGGHIGGPFVPAVRTELTTQPQRNADLIPVSAAAIPTGRAQTTTCPAAPWA
jgi:hypothetical protein